MIISELRSELQDENELLSLCQQELENMASFKGDMDSIKSDLETTIDKVAEEKQSLLHDLRNAQSELCSKTYEMNKLRKQLNTLKCDRMKSTEVEDDKEKIMMKLIKYEAENERLNEEIGRMRRAYAGLVSAAESSNFKSQHASDNECEPKSIKKMFNKLQHRMHDAKDKESANISKLLCDLKGERSTQETEPPEKMILKLINYKKEIDSLKRENQQLKTTCTGILNSLETEECQNKQYRDICKCRSRSSKKLSPNSKDCLCLRKQQKDKCTCLEKVKVTKSECQCYLRRAASCGPSHHTRVLLDKQTSNLNAENSNYLSPISTSCNKKQQTVVIVRKGASKSKSLNDCQIARKDFENTESHVGDHLNLRHNERDACDCTVEHVKHMLDETNEALVAVIDQVKKIPKGLTKGPTLSKVDDEMDFIGGDEGKPALGLHECARIKDLTDRLKMQYSNNKQLKEQLEIMKKAAEGDNCQKMLNDLIAQNKLLEEELSQYRIGPDQQQTGVQIRPDAQDVGLQRRISVSQDQTQTLGEVQDVSDLMRQLQECKAKLQQQEEYKQESKQDEDLLRQLKECHDQLQRQISEMKPASQIGSEIGLQVGPQVGAQTGSQTEPLITPQTDAQTESQTGPQAATQTGPQTGPQTGTQTLPQIQSTDFGTQLAPTTEGVATQGPPPVNTIDMTKQLNECRAQLKNLQMEMDRLKQELNNARNDNARLMQDQPEQVADLMKQLQECRDELQRQLAKLQEQPTTSESPEVANLLRQLQECRDQLGRQLQSDADMTDLKKQLEECRSQLHKQLSQIHAETQSTGPGVDAELLRQLEECRAQLQKQASLMQGQTPAEGQALSEVSDLKRQLEECRAQIRKQEEQLKAACDAQIAQLMKQLEESRAQLQNQVSQLQQQVTGPSAQEKALQTDVSDLKTELESLRKTLSDKDDEVSKAKQSLTSCQNALESKNKEISDLQSEIERLKSELNNAQNTLNEKERQLAAIQSEAEKLKQDLKVAQDLANEKARQIENLQADLNKSKEETRSALQNAGQQTNELANLQSEIDKLKNALKAALDSSEAKNRELADCQSQMQKVRQDLEAAQKQLTLVQQELNNEKQNLLAAQQEISQLKTDLKTAKDNNEELKKQSTVLQGDLQAELTRLRAELSSLQQQLSAKDQMLKDQQAAHQAEISQLKKDLQESKSALVATSQRAASSESDLQTELNRLRQENANLQSQLNAKNNELESIKRDKAALQDSIESWKQKHAQLEIGCQGDIKALKSENDALKEELRKLKESLAKQATSVDITDHLDKEKKQQEDLQAIIDNLQKELAICNKKIKEVPTSPSGPTEQIKLLTSELEKAHARIAELENEVARLKQQLSEVKSSGDKALAAKLVETKGALAIEENASVDRMQEIIALTRKVNELTKENDRLKKENEDLKKANAELRRQLAGIYLYSLTYTHILFNEKSIANQNKTVSTH